MSHTNMETAERVRENRLRRALERQGFRLLKSRARDPRALTYGGYQIIDPESGGCVAGWSEGGKGPGYTFDLDDVEAWTKATDDEREDGSWTKHLASA